MTEDPPFTDARPPFYMLYVRGKGAPTVFHHSFDGAATEAERLALKESTTVAVLQGVAICVPPDLTPSWEFADNVTVAEAPEAEDNEDELFQEILSWLFPRK